jgi:hypothetical protein
MVNFASAKSKSRIAVKNLESQLTNHIEGSYKAFKRTLLKVLTNIL